MDMIKRVSQGEAEVVSLPGRDWLSYIGPHNTDTQQVSVGMAVYPSGSRPTGHVHDTQEETIVCTAGRGRLVTQEETAELEPGVAVWIPPGTFHSTESDGPEPLQLICLFAPPVVPGSYEKRTDR
jgi:quercetin dioxygenase-like cupin family protein